MCIETSFRPGDMPSSFGSPRFFEPMSVKISKRDVCGVCHKEDLNSHVMEDHIGVCHMKTNMNKKASEHMNFREHTRNIWISTDKSAFRARRTTQTKHDCIFA